MSRAEINISGACGGGSSTKIYETPDYLYPWHGAQVMHGSFGAGPNAPDSQRVEVVELCLPGLDIRVRADSVRVELRALLTASKPWESDSAELRQVKDQAFVNLQAAVFGVAAREITAAHIERIAHGAYADGLRHGEELMQRRFRQLLGL